MTTVKENLYALRMRMQEKGVSAVIVPGTDPHASEYSAEHWKERVWISGFDGSAGTVLVTMYEAGLWTDSRYFLQAAEQLEGSSIQLFKDGLVGTPTITEKICATLQKGETVAVNPEMFSIKAVDSLQRELKGAGLNLSTQYDFIGDLWISSRPSLPKDFIFELPETYSGECAAKKIEKIRSRMEASGCDATLYSGLDEIAWLFNIRGTDVDYNPVVISYAVIQQNAAFLFIDLQKVPDEVAEALKNQGVVLCDYSKITRFLSDIPAESTMAMDFGRINYAIYQSAVCKKKDVPSEVVLLKSVKNEVELSGTRAAMIRDGEAMVQFLKWLEDAVKSESLTEISVSEKLKGFRAGQSLFAGESFGTIAGYEAHGAIVHYSATEASNAQLKDKGFLLLDSGGQYFDGTTDITRTIALGRLTQQQKRDFTLVLKGHIALACAKFPYGTRGSQLDVLARQFLWQSGLNYGHGTGHGVGHFLCVHEGPQNIRMDENPTILQPGMIISNEPGLYRTNQYGIRIENLVTVVEKDASEFGLFLGFETLTLCPIDKNAIDISLLSDGEKQWLNAYHRMVYDKIAPLLDLTHKQWLKEKTDAIQ